jgi:hypothetical protein
MLLARSASAGVGSASAGSVPCVPRTPLVVRSLSLLDCRTLVEVIQSVVGADRVRVFGCPGGLSGRIFRTARRAGYLTGESTTRTNAHQDGCTHRSRNFLVHQFLLSPEWTDLTARRRYNSCKSAVNVRRYFNKRNTRGLGRT